MRRKGDESGKRMEGKRGFLIPVLLGTVFSLGLLLLLVLGIAGLIWSGTLPASTPSIALGFCMGACAFAGGRFAIRKGSDPILTGILTGGVTAVVIAIVCLVFSGELAFHGRFLATILLTLAGGALSGLMGGPKKRKKKKKK